MLYQIFTYIKDEDRIFTPNKPWCCKGWKALPLFPHFRAFHFHCKITNKYITEYLRKFRMCMLSATLCWILSQNGNLISFGGGGDFQYLTLSISWNAKMKSFVLRLQEISTANKDTGASCGGWGDPQKKHVAGREEGGYLQSAAMAQRVPKNSQVPHSFVFKLLTMWSNRFIKFV